MVEGYGLSVHRIVMLLLLSGCVADESVDITFALPSDAPTPLTFRISVGEAIGGCAVRVVEDQVRIFTEGETPPRIGRLRRGPTVFMAEAWNPDCTRCFTGCAAIEVGADETVRIEFDDSACGVTQCVATDAGIDGGRDASGDVLDVSIDVDMRDGATPDTTVADASDTSTDAGVSVLRLGAGARHTCAIRGDGQIFCWGDNRGRQVGGTDSEVASPRRVVIGGSASRIEGGDVHSCAIVDGDIYCWGTNEMGFSLGYESAAPTPTPMLVRGLPDEDAVDLAVGWWHSCAALANDAVYCWGQNQSGELGACCAENPRAEVVPGQAGDEVAAGCGPSCRRGVDDRLVCWGYNLPFTPLGTPETERASAPAEVQRGGSAFTGTTRIESGGSSDDDFGGHLCALRGTELYCWGRNDRGQVGSGSDDPVAEPFAVPGVGNVFDVATGGRHTCAIAMDRRVFCWGDDSQGQLGDGEAGGTVLSPGGPIPSLRADQVVAGANHTCALDGNTIWCWGAGTNGQLGNGAGTSSSTPVRVNSLE